MPPCASSGRPAARRCAPQGGAARSLTASATGIRGQTLGKAVQADPMTLIMLKALEIKHLKA